MRKNLIDFSIGCDPEMLMVKNGNRTICAENICSDGELGADGNGVLFEVRPHFSNEPIQVVKNIKDVLTRYTYDNPTLLRYRWLAGSFHNGYGIGGHIHFGTKNKINRYVAAEYLDNYVGLISVLIENKKEGLKRRATGYGAKGDVREQNHGFEYRTCSSWITSPYVSLGILSLAKTVIHEALNNPKFKVSFYPTIEDFRSMRTEQLRRNFSLVWKDITKMSLYQKYKPYIDVLYFLVRNNLSWYPRCSMQQSWGIINLEQFNKKELIDLGVIWERYQNSLPKKKVRLNNPDTNESNEIIKEESLL